MLPRRANQAILFGLAQEVALALLADEYHLPVHTVYSHPVCAAQRPKTMAKRFTELSQSSHNSNRLSSSVWRNLYLAAWTVCFTGQAG